MGVATQVRNSFVLGTLWAAKRNALVVGASGAGKTVLAFSELARLPETHSQLVMNFSATTDSGTTQVTTLHVLSASTCENRTGTEAKTSCGAPKHAKLHVIERVAPCRPCGSTVLLALHDVCAVCDGIHLTLPKITIRTTSFGVPFFADVLRTTCYRKCAIQATMCANIDENTHAFYPSLRDDR